MHHSAARFGTETGDLASLFLLVSRELAVEGVSNSDDAGVSFGSCQDAGFRLREEELGVIENWDFDLLGVHNTADVGWLGGG